MVLETSKIFQWAPRAKYHFQFIAIAISPQTTDNERASRILQGLQGQLKLLLSLLVAEQGGPMKPTETDLKPRSKSDFVDDSPVEFKLNGYSRSREILFKSPVQNSKTTVLPRAYTISLYSPRSSPHTGIAPSAYKQTSSG